jgi:dihydroorotate dehydrogenase (NAD+) catalytic subunit
VPIIGMGGVSTAADAIEMMIAGADAVGVGTAIFRDPGCLVEIVDGIDRYLDAHGIAHVSELVNTLVR